MVTTEAEAETEAEIEAETEPKTERSDNVMPSTSHPSQCTSQAC